MKYTADNIAITGISGIFPGAQTIDRFTKNIMAGFEAIVDVPDHRWIIPRKRVVSTDYLPDKACSGRAGLVQNFTFDPADLSIDQDLASALDPVHQMVLHAGREALQSCSHTRETRSKTGVILAAISLPTQASSDISRRIIMGDGSSISRAEILSSGVVSVPASILARALGLAGGSYTLDAACASSLYAIKLACRELKLGRADMMIAGGVSRPDSLYTQVGFTQLKALSPTGRCAPFDRSADGLVVGEGAGIVVLKRLDDAVAAGDKIWGVIRGSGWSNDIGGNLVAPSSDGQIRAMAAAFRNAGWLPEDIQHLECHGSATPVGDTIELNSMRTLWTEAGCANASCAIGSIKSMTGHLLTAAGAAGLIKTLVAMDEKLLPPSLHFKEPPSGSPLYETGFRVQTRPEPWEAEVRRAGISGFGFGGINAHVLVEEFTPGAARQFFQPGKVEGKEPEPVAIVGMAAMVATADNLEAFKEQVLSGKTRLPQAPGQRWRVIPSDQNRLPEIKGFWIDQITTFPGEFNLPPNQIADLLPQHLIMLKAAKAAMEDAALPMRPGTAEPPRTRFGAAIGIEFDYGATDFHLRWSADAGSDEIKNNLSPPLTAERTLGALGGIVASRMARQFKLGGPCFTVSAQAESGLRAMEIGVNSLQSGETDLFLCGAVDMAGDLRQTLLAHVLTPFSDQDETRPFDENAQGTHPSEGACALILKPLDRAIKDNDRIYSIIRGTGNAGPGNFEGEMSGAYKRSLERCLAQGNIPAYSPAFSSAQSPTFSPASSIGLYEAHAGADLKLDAMELNALDDLGFNCAVGSAKATCGDTGAVAGLLSVIKASLALFHHIVPPVPGFAESLKAVAENSAIRIPKNPAYWVKKGKEEPRLAMVAAITRDGGAAHLMLEEIEYPWDIPCLAKPHSTKTDHKKARCGKIDRKSVNCERINLERLNPLGNPETTLFVVKADSRNDLINRLQDLDGLINRMESESPCPSCYAIGATWFSQSPPSTGPVLSILARSVDSLKHLIQTAIQAVETNLECQIKGLEGIAYTLNPMGKKGKTAFVYPGSGNHFPGMGEQIGALFPEIRDQMEQRGEVHARNLIYSQVFLGDFMTRVARTFGLTPGAGIGHSLGETASLFSLGVWDDPGAMLDRMERSDLFTEKLDGKFLAVKQSWGLAEDETPEWVVAAVNRNAQEVEARLGHHGRVYLLIKNTPEETVIGGDKDCVNALIKELGCGAMFLEGVMAVHCPIVESCADEYRDLHKFVCTPCPDIDFYSCTRAGRYIPTTETAAQSILDQAVKGFDYVCLINQAWEDGIRVFVEMGPGSSCTRAIGRILQDREHLALSLSSTRGDDLDVLLQALAALAAHGVDLDLTRLFLSPVSTRDESPAQTLSIPTSRSVIDSSTLEALNTKREPAMVVEEPCSKPEEPKPINTPYAEPEPEVEFKPEVEPELEFKPEKPALMKAPGLLDSARLTSRAHESFLTLTQSNMKAFETQFAALARAAAGTTTDSTNGETSAKPLFDREACLEFAIGRAGNVIGEAFDIIDSYPVRVRLPDEPLMLVDRIMEIEGEMLSMGPGKIVTHHDVRDNAWYLDGNKAPVCITIEAGQADLFLCSWLGIDHKVKGKRSYRLLDARVTFHRTLPCPGETIEYHIEIDRFLKQGESYLFFFHYRGYINGELLISMRDGCAGFFTPEEVKNSGGIILKSGEKEKIEAKAWLVPPVEMVKEAYDDGKINALRRGALEECFGPHFKGIVLGQNMRLPGGRMHLLDRVTEIDPNGGRFGLGRIRAEADISPDDWFLTCHFVDDMVMPGTLMYECCAHTLRVFTQRMGWVSTRDEVHYDVIQGIESDLKCRGPVTVHTRKARYEIEIKEIGYDPEPYVIADAHMFSDNHRIVLYKNMGLKIAGLTRQEIERTWS